MHHLLPLQSSQGSFDILRWAFLLGAEACGDLQDWVSSLFPSLRCVVSVFAGFTRKKGQWPS